MSEGELGGRFERDMIVFVIDKDATSSQSSSDFGLHALNQLEKKDDDTRETKRDEESLERHRRGGSDLGL